MGKIRKEIKIEICTDDMITDYHIQEHQLIAGNK